MRARALALVLPLLAAGCGDPVLWSRWQAESALEHARRTEHHVLDRGSAARPAQLDRAEAALRAIVERFPLERWAADPHATVAAHDIGEAAAAAAIELGVVQAARGRDDVAIATWAGVVREAVAVPAAVVRAHDERIAALTRLGRFDDVLEERAALAAMDPLGGPGGEPLPDVLEAPIALAAALRERGRAEDARTVLRGADAHLAEAFARAAGPGRAPLADALSRVRAGLGDAPGALAALREAMPTAGSDEFADLVRLLAARALEAGSPESVFAYSRWAAQISDTRRVRGQAWLVAAQAWEVLGRPDSALANYDAILLGWLNPGTLGPEARYRRALLLERLNEWERAQSEYVSLQAAYPNDALAFLSARRIVQHHQDRGAAELARLSGETAVANLDHLLVTNADPDVQRAARAARAEILLAIGRVREAEDALLDVWHRFPADSAAEDGALRAARLGMRRPGGAARAEAVLARLRRTASSATVRLGAAGVGAPGN